MSAIAFLLVVLIRIARIPEAARETDR